MALATACGDLSVSTPDVLPSAELLILGLQTGAPAPQTATFFVSNARVTQRQLIHNDGFNTLYVRLTFPANSIVSRDGQPLGPQDSVAITVQPRAGQYGMTLSPAGVVFASGGGRPTAEFAFARYGDPGEAIGTSYSDADAYVRALSLWSEISPDRWARIDNSSLSGLDAIAARIDEGGRFVVAAPR